MRNALLLAAVAALCVGCGPSQPERSDLAADPLVGVSPDSFEPVDSGTGLATEQTYVTAIPATVAVPPPASAEPAERTYVIQRGDNLWQIAKRELGDGQRWKEILAANPGLNEKSLPIGRKIVLPAK